MSPTEILTWTFDRNVNYYYSTASFGSSPHPCSPLVDLTSIAHFSLVILFYDYMLTLPDEIELFWKAETSWVARFFLITRYFSLVGNIPIALQSYSDWSTSVSARAYLH